MRGTKNSMDRFRVVKYTAYALEILIIYIIQSTPNLVLEVFGGKPILLVPVAITIAVFEKEIPAIVFGVICGLITDMGYSGAVGYYGIMLAIVCFTVSNLMGNYIRTNLLTIMLIATISIPVIIFLQFAFYYIFVGYTDVWAFFANHYISRIIYTWAFTPVFYFFNRFIALRTSEK